MDYQISIKPSAEKALEKLPKEKYYKVLSIFTILSNNPFIGKKMKGEYKGSYAYRAWPYRIIYEIHKKELLILIIRIGHRGGVY